MNDNIPYAFVLRGVLARTAVETCLADGRDRDDRIAEVAARLPLSQMDADLVARAGAMAVVYTAIAAFEVSARAFIERRLLEEVGDDWWKTCVPEKRREKAESRRDEENKIRWHAKRGDSPLQYTEMSDLSAIITTNQTLFLPFIGSVDWSKAIFDSVERSRNIIMHSGTLEPEDVERLGIAIRDWLNQVGG